MLLCFTVRVLSWCRRVESASHSWGCICVFSEPEHPKCASTRVQIIAKPGLRAFYLETLKKNKLQPLKIDQLLAQLIKDFFPPKWIKITLFVACSKIILTHASDHKCIYYRWDQIAEWKSFKLNVIMGTLRWRLCTYSSHGQSPKDPILARACQRTNQTLVLALIRPEGQSAPQRNSGESSPITTSQCFWDPAKTRLYICI